jgi:tripeptide aminopeptidase
VDHFDVEKFGAKYAYTLDGSEVGELEFENFNAAYAKVKVQGRNVHPGYAKNKMKNAIIMGSEFNDMLPVFERPEFTEHYEGFFHIIKFEGTVEESTLQYIIRDHDRKKFERRKVQIQEVADFINKKYGEGTITIEMKDQYYNMREKVEPEYHIVEIAEQAMKDLGIKPHIKPIRGGTDGSRLSYMGLPCPNIFAGGINFHGKYEFVPLESMEKATSVMLKIINLYYEKA